MQTTTPTKAKLSLPCPLCGEKIFSDEVDRDGPEGINLTKLEAQTIERTTHHIGSKHVSGRYFDAEVRLHVGTQMSKYR